MHTQKGRNESKVQNEEFGNLVATGNSKTRCVKHYYLRNEDACLITHVMRRCLIGL